MTKLHIADHAPPLVVLTLDGAERGLSPATTLVSFHRHGGCPFCNLRVWQLADAYPRLAAAGLDVLCIFESSIETLKQSVGRRPLPFPIGSDPSLRSYNAWGVERSMPRVLLAMRRFGDLQRARELELLVKDLPQDGNTDRIPAEFVVDASGFIRLAHYAKDAGDHAPIEAVLATAARVTMAARPADRASSPS